MTPKKDPEYQYRYKKPKKSKRIEGDEFWYFLLHNVYSSLIFGISGYILGIFEYNFSNWWDFLTLVFFDALIYVMFLMILCGLAGRGLAYITLKIIFERKRKDGTTRVMKKIGELQSGINKLASWSYIISILLSAFIFTLGIFPILESRIFGTSTFTTIVWTYLIVKVSIFLIVIFISNFKM